MILTIIGVILLIANLAIFLYNLRLFRILRAVQAKQESVYMEDSIS